MAAIPFNCNLPEDLFTTNRAPTDEELATARVLITNLENKLLDSTTETADAGSTHSQNHILESLAALKTVVSPIRRVEEDIIREVFLTCLEPDPFSFPSVDDRDVPCTLSQISSDLRQIALSTQALWAAFRVNIDKRNSVLPTEGFNPLESTPRGHALLLDVWIHHRSGNLPLRIAIDSEPGMDNNNDLLNILLSCHSRWRDIYFEWHGTFTKLVASLKTFSAQDLPMLRTIDLGSPTHENTSVSSLPLFACTSLKRLYGISFEDVYKIRSLLPLSTITELQCASRHCRRPPLYPDFSSVLRQCVSLVHLDLVINEREEREPIKPIYLPHLRSLSIYEHVFNLRMLTAISAPQLEELHLDLDDSDHGRNTAHWPIDEITVFFKRSPKIQVLSLDDSPMPANTVLTILQCCPLLTTLQTPPDMTEYSSIWDSVFLGLIRIDTTLPVVCPKLQYLDIGEYTPFIITNTNFSTIKRLIKCKLEPSPLLAPWKRLKLSFRYTEAEKEEADHLLALNYSDRIIIVGHFWSES